MVYGFHRIYNFMNFFDTLLLLLLFEDFSLGTIQDQAK